MSSFLIVGDSHAFRFKSIEGVNYLESRNTFTAQRFYEQHTDIWGVVESFMKDHKDQGSNLLLSAGEIDIRGHYWRHYPRHLPLTIDQYVEKIAKQLFDKIRWFVDYYGLKHCVLWGPPLASFNTKNNIDWPFSGNVSTRNMMINAYNRTIINLIKNHGKETISFATGYYDHIDPDTYHPLNHLPTDGVHWNNNLSLKFWKELILPAFEGKLVSLNKEMYLKMKDHRYSLDIIEVESNNLHDAWIQVENCQGEHCIQYQGQNYQYKILPNESKFENYKELVLKIIN